MTFWNLDSGGRNWTVKGSAQTRIRVMARPVLREVGVPPDMRVKGTEMVLQQMELMAAD